MYGPHSELIYIDGKSLSKEICNDIIVLFESQEDKYAGVQGTGTVNLNVKNTTDYKISDGGTKWKEINNLLQKELGTHIIKYLYNFRKSINNPNYPVPGSNTMLMDTMQLQKYTKGIGEYIMHHDSLYIWEQKRVRQLTFIWYLNDVVEGGETEFWSNYNIKPEAGKLVIFPAHWTFPHRGKMPISSDKYIITGWLYSN
jgi:hypothetical protein